MPETSPIYDHLAHLGIKGHMLGRKLGVIQEVMVFKYLSAVPAIRERLVYNMSPIGYSGARHFVEFCICPLLDRAEAGVGEEIRLRTTPSGQLVLSVKQITDTVVRISHGSERKSYLLPLGRVALGTLGEILDNVGLKLKFDQVSKTSQGTLQGKFTILKSQNVLVNIESKRVGVEVTGGEKLAGPQTIEKAKQASLVAIDLELKQQKTIKPLRHREKSQGIISIVILGNGVHWEAKSLKVLCTFVDFVFRLKDDAVIKYINYVVRKAPARGTDKEVGQFLYDSFSGTLTTVRDDFKVTDKDFAIVCPETTASLSQIVTGHIQRLELA